MQIERGGDRWHQVHREPQRQQALTHHPYTLTSLLGVQVPPFPRQEAGLRPAAHGQYQEAVSKVPWLPQVPQEAAAPEDNLPTLPLL